MINFNVHSRAGQSPALRATLTQDTPAPVGSRKELRDRLGVTDADATDEQILGALDSELAAAKPVTAPKRVQPNAADAAYAKAWGPSAKTAPTASPADDALYALAWGTDTKGA